MRDYFIKQGYRCNIPGVYQDTAEAAATFQVPVYLIAQNIVKTNRIESVLDIGCGFGLKLRDFILPVCEDITGVEFPYSIEYCRRTRKFGKWIVDDVENPNGSLSGLFDLVMAADVIEHLKDPDRLLDYISAHAHHGSLILISTPERDIFRGEQSFGPPPNLAHVREWNARELYEYISQSAIGFKVRYHKIVAASRTAVRSKIGNLLVAKCPATPKRLLRACGMSCQAIVCEKITEISSG